MGSTFSDFLAQLPTAIFVPFCASALLLVIVIALIVRARVRRDSAPAVSAAPTFKRKRANTTASDANLPDLDMLLDTTTLTSAPPAPRPAQPGVQPLTLADGSTVQAVEVLRVLRDVTGGGLVVQMGSRAQRTLAGSDAFRADFLRVMRELSPLVRGEAAAPSAPMPAEPDADTETDEAAPSLGELLAVRETKRDFSPPPPPDDDGEMPGDLPRYDQTVTPPPKSGVFRRKKPDLPPIPDLDIAGSIEAYVQHRLQFTPELADRRIHIHPSPDGVLIEADGAFYDAVDAVDDDDVRAFLTLAIAEWQNRLR
jgi:hypothetical protein